MCLDYFMGRIFFVFSDVPSVP